MVSEEIKKEEVSTPVPLLCEYCNIYNFSYLDLKQKTRVAVITTTTLLKFYGIKSAIMVSLLWALA